jgi:hypothetical protein
MLMGLFIILHIRFREVLLTMNEFVRKGNNLTLVRWLAMWDQRQDCRTYVNVFPSARHVAAPYPVLIRLTVTGAQGAKAIPPVAVDGAKVNEPLQICLEEIFPMIKGVAGVIVELLPTRRSLELTLSRCIVERRSGGRILKYLPWSMPIITRPQRSGSTAERGGYGRDVGDEIAVKRAYPFYRNDHELLSLVAFNCKDEATAVRLGLRGISVDNNSFEVVENRELETVVAVNVGSNATAELPLRCRESKVAISLSDLRDDDIAIYVVGRVAATGDIRSAVAFTV